MKTSVIYSRISTETQDTSSQTEVLKKYSDDNNYKLVHEPFVETISGTADEKERKVLNQLKKYVESNKVDILLVFETSRLGRKTEEVLKTIRFFTERGINVYLMKERIFTLNEDGTKNSNTELVLTMMSGIATVERETTLARSRRGLRNNSKLLGHWTGGVLLPYGYKKEGKVLVVDEEEKEVIKKIFDWYVNGMEVEKDGKKEIRPVGTGLIAEKLNEMGIRTRYNKAFEEREEKIKTKTFERPASEYVWVDGTIYTILKNTIYIGQRKYIDEKSAELKEKLKQIKSVNKEKFIPTYDIINSPKLQIITEDTFNRTQERLKNNYNKIGKNVKHFYLLGDIPIKCGVCGLSYYAHKRTDGKDNRYICLSERKKPKCSNKGIGIAKLCDGIWWMVKTIARQDFDKFIKDSLDESQITKNILSKESNLSDLRKDLTNIDKKENYLIDMSLQAIERGGDPKVYDERLKDVQLDRNQYQTKFNKIENELNELKSYLDRVSNVNNQIIDIKDDKNKMKYLFNKVIKSLLIYTVSKNPPLGHIKDDINLLIKINLISTPQPIYFIISQRSRAILLIGENEFDFNSNSVIGDRRELKSRIKRLTWYTEKK